MPDDKALRAVYDDMQKAYSNYKNVSYDKFKEVFENNKEARKAVYDDMQKAYSNFKDVSYDKFESATLKKKQVSVSDVSVGSLPFQQKEDRGVEGLPFTQPKQDITDVGKNLFQQPVAAQPVSKLPEITQPTTTEGGSYPDALVPTGGTNEYNQTGRVVEQQQKESEYKQKFIEKYGKDIKPVVVKQDKLPQDYVLPSEWKLENGEYKFTPNPLRPATTMDYLIDQSINSSLIGSGMSAIAGGEQTVDYSNYTPDWWEDIVAGVIGIAIDSPVFLATGGVGAAAGRGTLAMTAKGVEKAGDMVLKSLVKRGMSERVAKDIITKASEKLLTGIEFAERKMATPMAKNIATSAGSSSTALGSYDFMQDVATQFKEGKSISDISWGQAINAGARGGTLGLMISPIGIASPFINKWIDKGVENNILNKISKGGAGLGELAVENTIFVGGGRALEGKELYDKDFWTDWGKGMMMLGLIKGQGAIQRKLIEPSKSFTDDKANTDIYKIELTPEELVRINKGNTTDEVIGKLKSEGGFSELMGSDNIPLATKQKIAWGLHGLKVYYDTEPTKVVRDDNADGSIDLKTINKDGKVINTVTLEDKAVADKVERDVVRSIVENDILDKVSEFTTEQKIDVENEMKSKEISSEEVLEAFQTPFEQRDKEQVETIQKFDDIVKDVEGKTEKLKKEAPVEEVVGEGVVAKEEIPAEPIKTETEADDLKEYISEYSEQNNKQPKDVFVVVVSSRKGDGSEIEKKYFSSKEQAKQYFENYNNRITESEYDTTDVVLEKLTINNKAEVEEFESLQKKELIPLLEEQRQIISEVQKEFSDGKDYSVVNIGTKENPYNIEIRIKDHSSNPSNFGTRNDVNEYLSIVITDKDLTKNKFKENEADKPFNEIRIRPSENSVDEIKQIIKDKIKEIYDNKNTTGVSGEVREGQEPVEAKPVETGSDAEIKTSGVVQTPPEKVKGETKPIKSQKEKQEGFEKKYNLKTEEFVKEYKWANSINVSDPIQVAYEKMTGKEIENREQFEADLLLELAKKNIKLVKKDKILVNKLPAIDIIEKEAKQVKSGVEGMKEIVSTDDLNIRMQHILVAGDNLIATDGHKLLIIKNKNHKGSDGDLINPKTGKIEKQGDIGKYPNYKAILESTENKNTRITNTLPIDDLLLKINGANEIGKNTHHGFSVIDFDFGVGEKVFMNSDTLLSALKVLKANGAKNITIKITSEEGVVHKSAILIEADNGNKALVMPQWLNPELSGSMLKTKPITDFKVKDLPQTNIKIKNNINTKTLTETPTTTEVKTATYEGKEFEQREGVWYNKETNKKVSKATAEKLEIDAKIQEAETESKTALEEFKNIKKKRSGERGILKFAELPEQKAKKWSEYTDAVFKVLKAYAKERYLKTKKALKYSDVSKYLKSELDIDNQTAKLLWSKYKDEEIKTTAKKQIHKEVRDILRGAEIGYKTGLIDATKDAVQQHKEFQKYKGEVSSLVTKSEAYDLLPNEVKKTITRRIAKAYTEAQITKAIDYSLKAMEDAKYADKVKTAEQQRTDIKKRFKEKGEYNKQPNAKKILALDVTTLPDKMLDDYIELTNKDNLGQGKVSNIELLNKFTKEYNDIINKEVDAETLSYSNHAETVEQTIKDFNSFNEDIKKGIFTKAVPENLVPQEAKDLLKQGLTPREVADQTGYRPKTETIKDADGNNIETTTWKQEIELSEQVSTMEGLVAFKRKLSQYKRAIDKAMSNDEIIYEEGKFIKQKQEYKDADLQKAYESLLEKQIEDYTQKVGEQHLEVKENVDKQIAEAEKVFKETAIRQARDIQKDKSFNDTLNDKTVFSKYDKEKIDEFLLFKDDVLMNMSAADVDTYLKVCEQLANGNVPYKMAEVTTNAYAKTSGNNMSKVTALAAPYIAKIPKEAFSIKEWGAKMSQKDKMFLDKTLRTFGVIHKKVGEYYNNIHSYIRIAANRAVAEEKRDLDAISKKMGKLNRVEFYKVTLLMRQLNYEYTPLQYKADSPDIFFAQNYGNRRADADNSSLSMGDRKDFMKAYEVLKEKNKGELSFSNEGKLPVEEAVKKAKSLLTPAEREVFDAMQNYFETTGNEKASAAATANGINYVQNPFYFPVPRSKYDSSTAKKDLEELTNKFFTGTTKTGSVKERTSTEPAYADLRPEVIVKHIKKLNTDLYMTNTYKGIMRGMRDYANALPPEKLQEQSIVRGLMITEENGVRNLLDQSGVSDFTRKTMDMSRKLLLSSVNRFLEIPAHGLIYTTSLMDRKYFENIKEIHRDNQKWEKLFEQEGASIKIDEGDKYVDKMGDVDLLKKPIFKYADKVFNKLMEMPKSTIGVIQYKHVFLDVFEFEAGQKFNFKEYNENPEYRKQHSEEIRRAVASAEEMMDKYFTPQSRVSEKYYNPISKSLKNKAWQAVYLNYMNRFTGVEATRAKEGVKDIVYGGNAGRVAALRDIMGFLVSHTTWGMATAMTGAAINYYSMSDDEKIKMYGTKEPDIFGDMIDFSSPSYWSAVATNAMLFMGMSGYVGLTKPMGALLLGVLDAQLDTDGMTKEQKKEFNMLKQGINSWGFQAFRTKPLNLTSQDYGKEEKYYDNLMDIVPSLSTIYKEVAKPMFMFTEEGVKLAWKEEGRDERAVGVGLEMAKFGFAIMAMKGLIPFGGSLKKVLDNMMAESEEDVKIVNNSVEQSVEGYGRIFKKYYAKDKNAARLWFKQKLINIENLKGVKLLKEVLILNYENQETIQDIKEQIGIDNIKRPTWYIQK